MKTKIKILATKNIVCGKVLKGLIFESINLDYFINPIQDCSGAGG